MALHYAERYCSLSRSSKGTVHETRALIAFGSALRSAERGCSKGDLARLQHPSAEGTCTAARILNSLTSISCLVHLCCVMWISNRASVTAEFNTACDWMKGFAPASFSLTFGFSDVGHRLSLEYENHRRLGTIVQFRPQCVDDDVTHWGYHVLLDSGELVWYVISVSCE